MKQLSVQQFSSLQLVINQWITAEGGAFGRDLVTGIATSPPYQITTDSVSYQMAAAAAVVFEMAADCVERSISKE